jgi:hypothetical protein
VLAHLHTVIYGWLWAGAPAGEHHGIRGNFRPWAQAVDGLLGFAGIKGFGGNFDVFANREDSADEGFLLALLDHFGADRYFTRAEVEALLAQVEQRVNNWQGMVTRPSPPRADGKLTDWAVFADVMPTDRMGKPLQGHKLASMLNGKHCLPVEHEGTRRFVVRKKVQGARGWQFVASLDGVDRDDA